MRSRRRRRRGSQPRLALAVGIFRCGLGGGTDEPRHLETEALAELGRIDTGVLDDVVQDGGSDDLITESPAAQQLRDLERVQDERRAIGLPPLPLLPGIEGDGAEAFYGSVFGWQREAFASSEAKIDELTSRKHPYEHPPRRVRARALVAEAGS
jgi:hypothetical protein